MARWRAVVALLLVALVLTACEGGQPRPAPSPTPTPLLEASPTPVTGLSVAVVLPPPDVATEAERASLKAAINDLGRAHREGIGQLRVVDPDGLSFVGDTAALLAREGVDLVCALGTGAIDQIVQIASDYPSTRFCVAPATPRRTPGNVLPINVRVEEMGYLAGVAAGMAGDGHLPGFIGGDRQHGLDRQRRGYEQGLAASRAGTPQPLVSFAAVNVERAHSLALAQYEAGVSVVYTVAGEADAGVLEAAQETAAARAERASESAPAAGPSPAPSATAPGPPAPALVIGRHATLVPPAGTEDDSTNSDSGSDAGETSSPDGGSSDHVLLSFHERLDVALDVAISRALEKWSADPATVGLAEGAFEVEPGSAREAAAIGPRIEQVIRAIREQQVQVLPPS